MHVNQFRIPTLGWNREPNGELKPALSLLPPAPKSAMQFDMVAQRLARRAEDREVPGSSPVRD